jgi:hypothetical protein
VVGYYLKGDDGPAWITEGVSFLDQDDARKEKDKEKH